MPRVISWDVRPFDLVEFKKVISKWQTGLHGRGWNSNYLMNHDQPRSVSRFGDDGEYRVESAKLLLTFLMTLEGTPYIYQGEEIGMINSGFEKIEDYRDVEIMNHFREAEAAGKDTDPLLRSYMKMSRDNSRTPMQWSGSPNAGFSTAVPWIKPGVSWKDINVENDLASGRSIIKYFRMLRVLRKGNPVLVYGEFELLLPEDEELFIYRRILGTAEIIVVLNFSSRKRTLSLLPGRAELLLSNLDRPSGPGRVEPWEAKVYEITPKGGDYDRQA